MSVKLLRTPAKSPLKCLGQEYDPKNPTCAACPHQADCLRFMGFRAGSIRLSEVKFDIIPAKYNVQVDTLSDPEADQLESLYQVCYQTVFGGSTVERVSRWRQELLEAAARAGCSLRLYFLASMVSYRDRQEKEVDPAQRKPFMPSMLLGSLALKRVKLYAELCAKYYGVFDASALETLTRTEYADKLEQAMLNSEVAAGRFLVGYKLFHGGPPWEALFEALELSLDPRWLAIEPWYKKTVLDPYLENRRGTAVLKSLRFSVCQIIADFKRHRARALAAFTARQAILPKALREICQFAGGYRPEQFDTDMLVVQDAMDLWNRLSRVFQHVECLKYLQGEDGKISRRFAQMLREERKTQTGSKEG